MAGGKIQENLPLRAVGPSLIALIYKIPHAYSRKCLGKIKIASELLKFLSLLNFPPCLYPKLDAPEMGRWGDGEVGRWGRWGVGESGGWGDGETGSGGDGVTGRGDDGENYCLLIADN
ncbi:MAG: hypothetical protein SW833_04800 [Cyanobacteriota bacterium]|nr:hypothetical protein [Cyanobacteriota bacterium]